jgi:hypothetical protein
MPPARMKYRGSASEASGSVVDTVVGGVVDPAVDPAVGGAVDGASGAALPVRKSTIRPIVAGGVRVLQKTERHRTETRVLSLPQMAHSGKRSNTKHIPNAEISFDH